MIINEQLALNNYLAECKCVVVKLKVFGSGNAFTNHHSPITKLIFKEL